MKIEFLPEAKDELDDAVEYYELQVKGLGQPLKVLLNLLLKEYLHSRLHGLK